MIKKLFIPGPVVVKEDVLNRMASPVIGHRTVEASVLQRSITDKLRRVFNTKEQILLSTSSGSGLMEGAIRSCTLKKAAVFSIGVFGTKWYEMAKFNNVAADLFEIEWGKAITKELVDSVLKTGEYDLVAITHNETSTGIMNPIEEIAEVIKSYDDVIFCLDAVSSLGGINVPVDAWGVDICITSSQKCLALPPGFSMCSFSKKAAERARKVPFRGVYLDLLNLYEYVENENYQYPSTPSLPHMFALDYQLDKIFEEGLENRYQRHMDMANRVREWARGRFELFGDNNHLSDTVTVVKNTRNIDVDELNRELSHRGYIISNGYGILKDKTFRIGHMGDCTLDEINEVLDIIDDILKF